MRLGKLLGIASLGCVLGLGCAEQPGKKKDDDKKDAKDSKRSGRDGKKDDKAEDKAEDKADPPK